MTGTTAQSAGSRLIVLIAPNVSEQQGGEAIKALQIFRTLKSLHPDTVQIVHERFRAEVEGALGLTDVHFVEDTVVARLLWRSVVLRAFVNQWFSWKAVALAKSVARSRGRSGRAVIVHQTEPNSPVSPRALARGHVNVFGPINGNIYYPAAFRDAERPQAAWRRRMHRPLQRLNRLLPGGIKRADLVLTAGGDRTIDSLKAAGCTDDILLETVDCGLTDDLLARPRIRHDGENHRFVHFGRLVLHKGTALAIEALALTSAPVRLDVVGQGPELEACRQLATDRGVADRVRFLPWYADRDELLDSLAQYRGMVLPSFEDANGIVVQESMALGLPSVCLDWGGPQLLVEHDVSGFLVAPTSRADVIADLARILDRLGNDGELAERISRSARERAERWRWADVGREWLSAYPS
jgi:glycosyltransferase involved in cell wall biosynthesis